VPTTWPSAVAAGKAWGRTGACIGLWAKGGRIGWGFAPVEPKPALGAPCNGCGACCLAETCSIGADLLGLDGPCPALEQDAGRYWCGLVRHPARYIAAHFPAADHMAFNAFFGELVERALGIGRGCDSDGEA
jgi:hypothetical protein